MSRQSISQFSNQTRNSVYKLFTPVESATYDESGYTYDDSRLTWDGLTTGLLTRKSISETSAISHQPISQTGSLSRITVS